MDYLLREALNLNDEGLLVCFACGEGVKATLGSGLCGRCWSGQQTPMCQCLCSCEVRLDFAGQRVCADCQVDEHLVGVR